MPVDKMGHWTGTITTNAYTVPVIVPKQPLATAESLRQRIQDRQQPEPERKVEAYVGAAQTRTPRGTQVVAVPAAGVEAKKVDIRKLTPEQKIDIVRQNMPRQELKVKQNVPKSYRTVDMDSVNRTVDSTGQVEAKKKLTFSLKKTLFREKKPVEDFYADVKRASEVERKYYESPYFKTTEKIAAIATFGYGKGGRIKPQEERSVYGQVAQEIVKAPLNIPGGLFGLAMLTPRKAELTGKGLGYEETRESTKRELGLGAPVRTVGIYDPRTPTGFATLATAVTVGLIKGRADTKSGKFGGTKVETKSSTYRPPQTERYEIKTVGKRGSVASVKVAGKEAIFVRKEGPLKFQYERKQILQKATGRSAPTVTVSEGTITRGGQTFKTSSVQVGRKTYGSIIGKSGDIVYQKSPKGGIQVKYLKKETIQPRYIREIKSGIQQRASTFNIDVEPSLVKKVRTVQYQPETISLQRTSKISGRKINQLDLGKRLPGGEEVYPRRATAREKMVNIFGESDQFVKGRDIQKGFVGKARASLQQTDTAGPQVEVVTIGKRKVITLRDPNVEYAIQPTYKPTTKVYKMGYEAAGPITITEYVRPPSLLTKRKTGFVSGTEYIYESSRYKPIKKIVTDIKQMGKKGQVSLTRGKVTVQAAKPTLKVYSPGKQPALSSMEILSILKEPSARAKIFPIVPTRQTTYPQVVPVTRPSITPISKIAPSVLVANFVVSKPETRIQPKADTRSFIITKPKVEVKPLVRVTPKTVIATKARTVTKTVTVTRTPTITRPVTTITTPINVIPRPIVPGPPPPVPGLLNLLKKRTTLTTPNNKKTYDVQVRERGRWKTVGKRLPRNKAHNLGYDVVDNTPTASFRLRSTNKKTKARDDSMRRGLNRLRLAKRDKNVFVEKNRYRIDTPGELKGITVKGYIASRKAAQRRKVAALFASKSKKKKSKGKNPKWL